MAAREILKGKRGVVLGGVLAEQGAAT